jgi:hypothetical protein
MGGEKAPSTLDPFFWVYDTLPTNIHNDCNSLLPKSGKKPNERMTKRLRNDPCEIHIRELPTSDLFPLDIERYDLLVDGVDCDVMFKGQRVGTIPHKIATLKASREESLRWYDVDKTMGKPKKEDPYNSAALSSLHVLGGLSFDRASRPSFFETPFPHGTRDVESIAMIGSVQLAQTYRLYRFWFADVPTFDRISRELHSLDPNALDTNTLISLEAELKKFWSEVHGEVLKRH